MKKFQKNTEKIASAISLDQLKPNQLKFWRNLFIYFWIAGIAGFFMELFWAWLQWIAAGVPMFHALTLTITPLAPPYGFGVVALVLFAPLLKRRNLILTFILTTIIMTLVEIACATVVKLLWGFNPFWDYTGYPYAFFDGDIYLKNCLLFGVVGVIFLSFVYPRSEKLFKRFSEKRIDEFFWLIMITYSLDLAFSFFNDLQSL